ncbi:uncharacterized protein EV422DRAFT_12553 [Fimicolochytrium jonesii]|uniref:uncharacterized protein n=1 Tax=Fimicolochytrium jonesii TaxID=1396493 RepID=UPI0022FF1934|nr:uncharacterized protein EV422DRAFT_12553 [Fimicolochytrium jonesii]KAI8826825.1 hypothetical protein EV422DRAFT_12553 [Fimicolochytrium jonesii]
MRDLPFLSTIIRKTHDVFDRHHKTGVVPSKASATASSTNTAAKSNGNVLTSAPLVDDDDSLLLSRYNLRPPVTLARQVRPDVTAHELTPDRIPSVMKMLYDSRQYSTTYRDIDFDKEEFFEIFGRKLLGAKGHLSVVLCTKDPATGQETPAFVTTVSDMREALDGWKANRDAIESNSSPLSPSAQCVAVQTFLEIGSRVMEQLYAKFHDVPIGKMMLVGGTAASPAVKGTNISAYGMQIILEKARRAGYVITAGWSSHPAMIKLATAFGGVVMATIDAREVQVRDRKIYAERGHEEIGQVFAGGIPHFE